MFKQINHSFAAKLNIYLISSAFLLWGIGFCLFYHYSSRAIEHQAYLKIDESAEKINLKVTRLLRTIEKIPENLSWIIPSYVTHADSIYAITRQVVLNNYEIFGCAIAFEPYYFPDKGYYFAPYSYMSGDSVVTTQIDPKYDYYQKNWYRISKERNVSRWSRPYHELSSNDILTSTYSVPLRDPKNNVIGIFSVDLSLNWLTELIDSVKPYEDSYSIIVNREGRYILHPGNDFFTDLDKDILHEAEILQDTNASKLAHLMMQGQKGKGVFVNNHVKYYIYFTPILGTEWNMATLFPYSHIFDKLHRFTWIIILSSVLFLALLVIICTTTVRKITRPLKIFAASTHSIAEGNFNITLPVIHTQDEMLDLYNAFSEMQEKLSKYMKNLETTIAAKEKIESELRIAHDIQMSMLPKNFPPFPGHEIDLYAVLYPARQVGGDLYDFFIHENTLFFAIGDVSGKGIPASLLMASTISLLRTLSSGSNSPSQIAYSLNNSIAERNEADMFVTFFIGMLDLRTGVMKYCNAGHTPPVLTSPDRTVAFFEMQSDLPLGILKNHNYQEYTYRFVSGSGILLYTDGVTDAENEKNEFYTRERLLEIVTQNQELHPREFIRSIINDIQSHIKSHELSDDLSMLTKNHKIYQFFFVIFK